MIKLKIILETKQNLVSKLVSIVRWFLSCYLISHQGFCYQI